MKLCGLKFLFDLGCEGKRGGYSFYMKEDLHVVAVENIAADYEMMAEDAVKMKMRTSKSPLLHDADDFM